MKNGPIQTPEEWAQVSKELDSKELDSKKLDFWCFCLVLNRLKAI